MNGRRQISRRQVLRGAGALGVAAWFAPEVLRAQEKAWAVTRGTVMNPAGTTLEATIIPASAMPYRRLIDGPGWPFVVRTLGPQPQSGREDRRQGLMALVHLTDIHLIDCQSCSRVEFLDRTADIQQVPFEGAYRAQETLTTQVAEAMIRRVNQLKGGPVTGRPFDGAVSTGDSLDNKQVNELGWLMTLFDGGRVVPNSGDPRRYEGVMDQNAATYDPHYWHPHDTRPRGDVYKSIYKFPAYQGLLDASIQPFQAEGLRIPWYTVYGNHDGLAQGTLNSNPAFEALGTGPLKISGLPPGLSAATFQHMLMNADPLLIDALKAAPARLVTPDAARRYASPSEWAAAHLQSRTGPHGYGPKAIATGVLDYTFRLAPGVVGIALDTVNRGGNADGTIWQDQLHWLQRKLAAAKDAGDLAVLFSHHNLLTLDNVVPDPAKGSTPRCSSAEVIAALHQHANVACWINGHTHENRIYAHPDPTGRTGGFWEITTAAHVDYPEHGRLIEIADNRDGTLSIFVTLIEHLAPAATLAGASDVLGLASISRELSANEYQRDPIARLGAPGDRNVELVVKKP